MKRFTKQLLLISLILLVFGCRTDDAEPTQTYTVTVSEKFYDYQGDDHWVKEMLRVLKAHPKAAELAEILQDQFGKAHWDLGAKNPNPIDENKEGFIRASNNEEGTIQVLPEILVPLSFDHTERVNAILGWRRLNDGSDMIMLFQRDIYEGLSRHQMMERQPRLVAGYTLAFENQLYGSESILFNGLTFTFEEGVTQQSAPPPWLSCKTIHILDPDTGEVIASYWFNCEDYTVTISPDPDPIQGPNIIEESPDANGGGFSEPTYYDPYYAANPYYLPGGDGNSTSYGTGPIGSDFPLQDIYIPTVHDRITQGPQGTDRQTLKDYLKLIAAEFEPHEDTEELAESICAAANSTILNENELLEISLKARNIYLETRLANFNIDLLSPSKHTSLSQEAAYIEVYPEVKEHIEDNGWPLNAEQWGALWDIFKPMLAEVLIEAIPGGGITLAFRDIVQGAQAGDVAALTIGIASLVIEFYPPLKVFKSIRKAGRVIKKGFKIARHALKHLSAIARALKKGLKVDIDGPLVKLTKNGDEVARISNNILEFNYSGFGGKITTNPNKTTTVIGKWQDPAGGGTAEIIESGLSKSGRNNGGINALSEDIPLEYRNNDSWIWNNVNEPWLRDAAERGDVIRVVSDPRSATNIFKPDGTKSFFGKEVDYLESLGYHFDPASSSFIK